MASARGAEKAMSALRGDLALRAGSGFVLAIIALLGAWFGGWLATLVVAVVVAISHREWAGLTGDSGVLVNGLTAGLVIALFFTPAGYQGVALLLVLALAVLAAASSREIWRPAGVLYAAVLGLGILFIRLSPEFGLLAIVFLLATVWATDTGAFFFGRWIGGAKLWPAVSPNKTWAGSIGGLVAGVLAAAMVIAIARLPLNGAVLAVAVLLSLAVQAGDLFESWVKRRAGAKDSGTIIPGHGGLLDRVDGLVFAAGAAAAVGWLHGGPTDIAGGLVAW
jgi:phosphatidate cytidylyltransferase